MGHLKYHLTVAADLLLQKYKFGIRSIERKHIVIGRRWPNHTGRKPTGLSQGHMEYTVRTRHIHSRQSYCEILLAADITMYLPHSHGSTITGLPEMYKWKCAEKPESSWSPIKHQSQPCTHFIYLPVWQSGKWPQYKAGGPKAPLPSPSLLPSVLPGRKWGQRHWLVL